MRNIQTKLNLYRVEDVGPAVLDRDPSLSPLERVSPANACNGQPFTSSVPDSYTLNWSEQLEELHEHSSRTHFIDVWTRRAMLERLGSLPARPTVIDVGCSTGYLLADLRARLPDAKLIGVDLVASGLRKAHKHVPDALLLQADVCALPLDDQCLDVAVSANLLEHVPDDVQALGEISGHYAPARVR